MGLIQLGKVEVTETEKQDKERESEDERATEKIEGTLSENTTKQSVYAAVLG